MSAQHGPDREPDERALLALFDETAEQASGPVLTKLRARAADAPLVARRRWRAFWFVAPGFVAGMAALLIAVGPSFHSARGTPSATAFNSAPTQARAPGAPATAQPAGATSTAKQSATPALVDDLGSLGDLDEDTSDANGDGLSLDPLYAPAPDNDVNAWLYATKTVLQDGI
jgi:hypothetical protein